MLYKVLRSLSSLHRAPRKVVDVVWSSTGFIVGDRKTTVGVCAWSCVWSFCQKELSDHERPSGVASEGEGPTANFVLTDLSYSSTFLL